MCLERWSSSELLHKLQCGAFFYRFTPPSTCSRLERVKLVLIDNTQYCSPFNYISPLSVIHCFENPMVYTAVSRKSIIRPRKSVMWRFLCHQAPFLWFNSSVLIFMDVAATSKWRLLFLFSLPFFSRSQRWIMIIMRFICNTCLHSCRLFFLLHFLYFFFTTKVSTWQVKWLNVSVFFMHMTRENAIDQPHLGFTQPIINVSAYFVFFRS